MEHRIEARTPRIIILLGAPGAGKDTQADLLVEELGFQQIPSSAIIRKKFAENPSDPVIRREQEKYDTGILNDPTLVGKWIMEYVEAQLHAGHRLVFSGSPRTPAEAKVELSGLDRLIGLQNVVAIFLMLDEKVERERIKKRRFCRANNHAIPGSSEFAHLTVCPQDGSELYVRKLDDPSLLDKRFQEYRERTEPAIALVRASGVSFYDIDGDRPIPAIHAQVVDIIER